MAKTHTVKMSGENAIPKHREFKVQSIARAAEILRVVADQNSLSLADIAAQVGLARSTVHRIILALVEERFLVANGPAHYVLGPEFVQLAEAQKITSLRNLHPYLVRLSRALHETVDLSIRTGVTATFVDQVVAQRRLRAVSALGLAFPLHCTANGKAILAALPADVVEALVNGPLEGFTSKTITEISQLKGQLAEARASGVAFDQEEHTLGICAVGSALLTKGGDVLSISVPMPAERFYGQEVRLAKELQSMMSEIVRALPEYRLVRSSPSREL